MNYDEPDIETIFLDFANGRSASTDPFNPISSSILCELQAREAAGAIATGPELLQRIEAERIFQLTPTQRALLGTPGFSIRLVSAAGSTGPVSFDFVGRTATDKTSGDK